MTPETLEKLEKGTPQLAALIKLAGEAADEACEAGLNEESASLRRAQGHLTLALAEGRCVAQIRGGGK